MPDEPRAVRALPRGPVPDSGSGVATGLVTRIVIVATVVLGQLFALTVALEASLLDHDDQAWLLAGFSLLSFALVVVLARVDPPLRAGRGSHQHPRTYVSRAIERRRNGRDDRYRSDGDPADES
ncbi:MAG: hypothetical protein WKF64_05230 [Ilumatobacteraceae bacterium]|jgi:hypothetical protein